MSHRFMSNHFDLLFGSLVHDISEHADYTCRPRGMLIQEHIGATVVLSDPRARLLSLKARDAQYGFGVGEFLWYWTGKRDLETLLYYNKRAHMFSDDGKTVNSAYGFRLGRDMSEMLDYVSDAATATNQWKHARKTLLADPDSRRAVMIINQARDQFAALQYGSKDVPCTLSLQFFIRNDELLLHVTMRSNDAVWGLTYDLFSFTLLQECMLLELRAAGMKDLKLGQYSHTAGSMHIYERHFSMADAVVKEYLSPDFIPAAPMESINLEGLARLVEDEAALRTGKVAQIATDRYSGGIRWMGEQLNAHRRKRDAERGRSVGPLDGARTQDV